MDVAHANALGIVCDANALGIVCVCSEEWSAELAGSFRPDALQTFLESSRVKFVSSGKVGGQQQWLFFAAQVCAFC